MILADGASIAIAGGFWLRRARVMDAWRIEVVGAGAQRAAFQAIGCNVEIINYQPRLFCPVGGDVLGRVLAKWPAVSVLAKRPEGLALPLGANVGCPTNGECERARAASSIAPPKL